MSGAHVDEHLLALVERRLPPAERARVEAHLAACARCRAAAGALFDNVEGLEALPGALRGLPVRAAQQWPGVWARVRAARPDAGTVRRAWPRLSVYLSLVTTFLVFLSVFPSGGQLAPASVTAGVAAGPQGTQPATVAFQAEAEPQGRAGTAALAAAEAAPTLAGTEPIQPLPIPTPVPGP